MSDNYRCDILIAGAGFAGALTALLLNRRGFSVCLVEKGHHPRFAIGESSTPIADLLLRDLSVRYDLPWLYPFSRYGSWQETHPEIVCGIKRGFSYFKHYPGEEFTTDAAHSQELLVAASADDRMSDTNWLRSDFDAFLVDKVKEAGIVYLDRTDIVSAQRKEGWTFKATRHGDTISINCSFFIDSTGTGNLLNNQLSIDSYSTAETNSYALFSHFDDVPRWTDQLKDAGIATHDFPYDPDHSALHQVLDEGWIWMLRFNDRRTSVGFALDGRKAPPGNVSPEEQWKQLLAKYPSIGKLLGGIGLSSVPGKLIRTCRLQRHLHCSSGPGWAALPHTAGFVDPLFSTGIAHTLTGIRRLVGILEKHFGSHAELKHELGSYSHAISTELAWIDNFVAGCYATMPYFELFRAWSMVYFAYTIMSEQRLLAGEPEEYYLGIDKDNELRRPHRALLKLFGVGENEFLSDRYVNAPPPSPDAIRRFTELVRESIAPYNTAGLMDPEARNMYRHTVAVL